jgi:hypothetical protein
MSHDTLALLVTAQEKAVELNIMIERLKKEYDVEVTLDKKYGLRVI